MLARRQLTANKNLSLQREIVQRGSMAAGVSCGRSLLHCFQDK